MAFLMVRSTYGIKGFSVVGKILMNRNIVFMPSRHKFVDMLSHWDFELFSSSNHISPLLNHPQGW